MSAIAQRMESARKLSDGVMPVDVIFATEAEVAEAHDWMKGKQKVKLLRVMTREEDARLKAEMRKKTDDYFRAREQWGKK